MWHTVFIGLHAATATVALLAGLVTVSAGRAFELYRWMLVAMAASLVAALVAGWQEFSGGERVIFPALLVLAVVMIYRAFAAGRMLPRTMSGPTAPYIDHVGFTLISLINGFAVVAVLRAGAPLWLMLVVAVSLAIAGHFALAATKARVVRPQTAVPVR